MSELLAIYQGLYAPTLTVAKLIKYKCSIDPLTNSEEMDLELLSRKYTLQEIPLGEIYLLPEFTIKQSKIQRFIAQIEEGSLPPPIIANQHPKKMDSRVLRNKNYLALDGYHRIKTEAKRGKISIVGYVGMHNAMSLEDAIQRVHANANPYEGWGDD